MITTNSLGFLVLALAAPALANVGVNVMVDHYIRMVNDMIMSKGYADMDATPYASSLPSEASNPHISNLSTIHRIGDVILDDAEGVYVEATIGLSSLVFNCDIRFHVCKAHQGDRGYLPVKIRHGWVEEGNLTKELHLLLWSYTMKGGLRMQLTENAITIGVRLIYDDKGCTAYLTTLNATLDGFKVEAWGMTWLGNYYVEYKARNMYTASKDGWESAIKKKIMTEFNSEATSSVFCSSYRSTSKRMDFIMEPLNQITRILQRPIPHQNIMKFLKFERMFVLHQL